MHNRMHDWSYHLGFVESTWNMQKDNLGRGGLGNDYEQGNAQAGAISGGPPSFAARNNANQFTPPDGQAPITNMYMWQPIAGSFYAPCVDGDYDMSVIGHEYGHAITNRMIAGPDAGRQLAAGHERELERPARHGVPRTSTATPRRASRPSPSASTRPATPWPASATTT